MTLSIERCSRCNGQGKIRLRVWESEAIISNLILLKAKYPLDELNNSMFLIKIKCPLCRGDGLYDWIKKAMRSGVNKKQKNINGNMNIYMKIIMKKLRFKNNSHQLITPNVGSLYKNPINVISCSQKRYMGAKLNNTVLTMRVRELEELFHKIRNFHEAIDRMPISRVTETTVIKEMRLLGLNGYLPDGFGYPTEDEIAPI